MSLSFHQRPSGVEFDEYDTDDDENEGGEVVPGTPLNAAPIFSWSDLFLMKRDTYDEDLASKKFDDFIAARNEWLRAGMPMEEDNVLLIAFHDTSDALYQTMNTFLQAYEFVLNNHVVRLSKRKKQDFQTRLDQMNEGGDILAFLSAPSFIFDTARGLSGDVTEAARNLTMDLVNFVVKQVPLSGFVPPAPDPTRTRKSSLRGPSKQLRFDACGCQRRQAAHCGGKSAR